MGTSISIQEIYNEVRKKYGPLGNPKINLWNRGDQEFKKYNELIVKGIASVKDNIDSGQFAGIQKAGIYALEHPEITEKTVAKYKRRLSLLVETLNSVGFSAKMPGGSFFLYVGAPKGIKGGRKFENGEEFSQYLITEMLISTVPWDDVGHYVRFSATFAAKGCLLYTSPSPRDGLLCRMPSSA